MKRTMLPVLASVLALAGCDQATTDGAGAMDPAPARSAPADSDSRRDADAPADITVQWRPADHSVGSGAFFRSELTIENRGPGALDAGGWRLHFSFVRRILDDGEGNASAMQDLAGQGLRVAKADAAASGDYYVLEPLPDFAPIGPGEQRTISFLAEAWAILKSDAPAGFHIAFDGEPPLAVPATASIDPADPLQTTRFEGDLMPVETAAVRHGQNPPPRPVTVADRLLPAPRQIEIGSGEVALGGAIAIDHPPELAGEAAYLTAALQQLLMTEVSAAPSGSSDSSESICSIRLRVDPALDIDGDGQPDREAYVLDVGGGKIKIRGSDPAGVFYGIQTLRQLVPADANLAAADPSSRRREVSLPEVHIADAPGFAYRGMHLDVARHFQPVAAVKKLIDLIAHYKLNKLHLHLTDDEGWRLEIPGIPELTGYGARRGHDLAELDMLHIGLGSGSDLRPEDGVAGKPADPTEANGGAAPAYQGFETATLNFVGQGDGYYTAREFEEILAYAAERHIHVIPEIDVPGHARAAVKAMEHRFRVHEESDPATAGQYRLLDPEDTSEHTSVQMYTDNFANPCLDSTYAFLTAVVGEIAARYQAAGAELVAIHAGGDELPSLQANVWWQGSPACAANPDTSGMSDTELFNLFFTRWHQIITATGAEMTGWDDIIHNGLALDGFIPMPWSNVWGWGREDDAYRYANQGYRVILSHVTNLYMDLAYAKDPDEPGYYWGNFVDVKQTFEYRPFDIFAIATHDRMGAPIDPSTWDGKERLSEAGKANVLGMHGLLWGENLKTPEILEYLAFPKLLGIAERAWNPEPPPVADMPESWARFASALGHEVLPRLGAYRAVDLRGELPPAVGVNYRIPPPGAEIAGGQLHASVQFPGLTVEYSTDGASTWTEYSDPVAVSGQVALRTRAPDGRSSRIVWLE